MAAPAAPVNLAAKLAQIPEPWKPKIVAEANGWHLKVVKLHGEFVWHHHDDTDEIFLVIAGELVIRLRDRPEVRLGPGEVYVVPRGVENQPVAVEECHAALIEPAGTVNTGDAESDFTTEAEWL